MFESITKW